MQHYAEVIWSTTNSNVSNHHAFGLRRGSDAAFCNGRIKARDGVDVESGSGLVSRTDRTNARMHPATFCERCNSEVKRMVDRRDGSMEARGMEYWND